MIQQLEQTVIDWSDFEVAGAKSREIVKRLVGDREAMRELVHRLEDDRRLFGMCERHELLDYLVLYDALERGIRIRLHLSTAVARDRPHDHRFSFSAVILRGGYRHTWHVMGKQIYGDGREEVSRRWQNRLNPDPSSDVPFEELTPVFTRYEKPGACYSLHHSMLHALETTPSTVSLILRGPAEKRRSIILDRATKTYWWRFGQEDETPERRAAKRMSVEDFREIRTRLENLEVI